MATPDAEQNAVANITARVDRLTQEMADNPPRTSALRSASREQIQVTANELLNHGISQQQANAYVKSSIAHANAIHEWHVESGGSIAQAFNRTFRRSSVTGKGDLLEAEAATAEQNRNNLRGSLIQTARDTAGQRASITQPDNGSLMAGVAPGDVSIGALTGSSPTGTTLDAVRDGVQENTGGSRAAVAGALGVRTYCKRRSATTSG